MASRKGGAGKSTLTAHLAALPVDLDDQRGPAVPAAMRAAS